MISTAYFLPPMATPPASALRTCFNIKGSLSPKLASGPVSGLRKPTLIVASAAIAGVASDMVPVSANPPAPSPVAFIELAPRDRGFTIALRVVPTRQRRFSHFFLPVIGRSRLRGA